MRERTNENEYDAVIVGSGTAGATVAREMARQGKRVLVLEQGANNPLKETFKGIASIAKEFLVGDDLKVTTVITAGGSTALYFAVCKPPNSDTFAALGIDLSEAFEEVKRELTIAELPDKYLTPQSLLFRDSAKRLGYAMKKNLMIIDQSKCASGEYSYEAKWKAKSYLEDAVRAGATLITNAKVVKVLVRNNEAVGVEYRVKKAFGSRSCQAYGKKVVLAAGSLATPKLLMDCGIKDVGRHGFYCKPGFMVFGTVPGLKGKDAFLGSMDMDLGNGISMGDGTMTESMFKIVMLSNFRFGRMFSHAKTVSAGILLNDEMGGTIHANGRYHKRFKDRELRKLKDAEAIAVKILENAGAKDIFTGKLVGGIPGGVLKVHEDLDENLQTKIRNLHVCDHTVINDLNSTPTVTLICLGKYLAKQLAAARHEPLELQAH